ncbi:unnamed protein product [Closterium sp. NIES-65]|nr:unnamed protein product [Closterium sp. NIES-65]
MEDGLISPLLRSDSRMGPILPSHHAPCDDSTSHVSHHPVRLASLDVFRGISIVVTERPYRFQLPLLLLASLQVMIVALDVGQEEPWAMIVALDVGQEVPWVGVSPWDGLQLGDFVAPFFLFASGAAAALTFRAVHSRTAAVHRILGRACCLFLLGLFLEGCHPPPPFAYHQQQTFLTCFSNIASVSLPALDISQPHTPSLSLTTFSSHSRTPFITTPRLSPCLSLHLPGTFQRIAVAYTVVALAQVLLSAPKDSHTEGYGEGLSGLLSFSLLTWQASLIASCNLPRPHPSSFPPMLHHSYLTWAHEPPPSREASLMLAAIYLALTFLLFVPDWTFTPPTSSASLSAVNSTFLPLAASAVSSPSQDLLVVCSRTGDLSPACSAAGYIDRLLPHHQSPPRLASLHPIASGRIFVHLCLVRFDFAFSSPAAGVRVSSTLVSPPSLPRPTILWRPGTPCVVLCTSHAARIINCLFFSALLVAAGFLLQFPSLSPSTTPSPCEHPRVLDISYPGLPFNAQLYSLSYVLITAGAAALLFALIYLFFLSRPSEGYAVTSMAAFLVITLIFFALGFLGCVLVRVLYDKGPSTNLQAACHAGHHRNICCWLSWAIVYMAQMHPLVVPILKAEGE